MLPWHEDFIETTYRKLEKSDALGFGVERIRGLVDDWRDEALSASCRHCP